MSRHVENLAIITARLSNAFVKLFSRMIKQPCVIQSTWGTAMIRTRRRAMLRFTLRRGLKRPRALGSADITGYRAWWVDFYVAHDHKSRRARRPFSNGTARDCKTRYFAVARAAKSADTSAFYEVRNLARPRAARLHAAARVTLLLRSASPTSLYPRNEMQYARPRRRILRTFENEFLSFS